MKITFFRLQNGHITNCGTLRDGQDEPAGLLEGIGWREGWHDASDFRIDIGSPEFEPVPLREFDTPAEVVSTIENIPDGTKAIVKGEGLIVDDGHITLEGSHGLEEKVRVLLQLETYRPKVVIVTCPEL